jgi:hypothetical protein
VLLLGEVLRDAIADRAVVAIPEIQAYLRRA